MEFYGRSRAALTNTTFSLPRAPQLTQVSPYTPNTWAQAPAWGDSPQNPTPSSGHAVLGRESAAEGPTGTRQHCQLPPASRLVKHSTPRGTCCRQGWKQPSLRRAPNAASPSTSTWKISCQGRKRTESPAPIARLVLGQKNQNPLIRCSTEVKPSVVRGSINSPSTTFSAHGKGPWGITKEITQQAGDKEFWWCTGISALFTPMKITKLPRAATILLLRGFIGFL